MQTLKNHRPAAGYAAPAFKTGKIVAALCLLFVVGQHLSPARASTFTWDPSGNGTGSDGSGTWGNLTPANWANGGSDYGWNNGDATDSAVIGAGSSAAGTITVGTIDLNSLTFNAPGSGNYVLTSGSLTFSGAIPTITVNDSATINSTSLVSSGTGASGVTFDVAAGQTLTLGTDTWSSTGDFTDSSNAAGTLTITSANTSTGSARFTVNNGQTFTITSGTLNLNPGGSGYFVLGASTSATATFTQTGGVVDYTDGGGSFYIGNSGNGAAVMNINGGTFNELGTAGTMFIGANAGNPGALNVGGGTLNLKSAIDDGNGATGTVTLSSGTISDTSSIAVGSGAANGVWTQTGGAASCTTLYVGDGSGAETGTMNLNGGTFTASANSYIGETSNGTFAQTSGSATFTNGLYLGGGGAAPGTINLSGGTFTIGANNGQIFLGATASGTGVLTISGSAVVNSNYSLQVGYASGGTGTVNMNGGTLNIANFLLIGNGGNGTFNQTGGVVTDNGAQQLQLVNSSAAPGVTGSLLITGGTFTDQGEVLIDNATGGIGLISVGGTGTFTQTTNTLYLGTGAGTATLTISGTGRVSLQGGGVNMGYTNGSTDTLNLNGGTLSTTAIARTSTTGTSVINFNGGTLQALGAVSIPAAITTAVQAGGAVFDTNGNTITVNGALVTGSTAGGGLTKQGGSGTLTLDGASTYTGPTIVNSGTLAAGVASVANVSGAFGDNSAVTLANTAGIAINITGFNTQIGSLTGGGAAGGNVILGSATLTVGGDNTSPAAFGGAISGAGGALTKIGSGTLTLAGSNTYTGATTITSGTLQLGNGIGSTSWTYGGQFSGAGTLAVANGSILTINGVNNQLSRTAGSGLIIGGTLAVANGIANTMDATGSLTLNGGVLTTIGTGNASFGSYYFDTSRTLTANGAGNLISGVNTLSIQSATLTFNTPLSTDALTISTNVFGGSGAVVKSGGGTVTLTGSNTYTGVTTVSQGTLQFGKETSLYNDTTGSWTASNIVVSNGATLAFNVGGSGQFTSADIGTLAGLGTASGGFENGAILGLDTTNASGGNFTYGTAIANPNSGANVLGLTKLGSNTLTLSANNTYTGATSVAAGTMIVSGSLSGSLATSVASGATLEADGLVDTAGTTTVRGTLDGTGKVGVINANGGVIAPGLTLANATIAPGTLTAAGAVTLSSTTNFDIRLGTATGSDFDQLAVTSGAVSLNGANLVLTLNGALNNPANIGDFYTILTSTAPVAGEFAQGTSFTTNGYSFDVLYNVGYGDSGSGDDVVLQLTAIPEPGTWATLLAGLGLLCAYQRRRGRQPYGK